ncbi:MAG TPA: ABC transporter ATP-binding protein, partial [Tepidisphaeraceae bacterium]|nr:ABC transporter ATP-binding protein [Tepidisphaeraceae bacterium]
MNDHVISAHGLTKYFGHKCAVDQATFAVPRGAVFAMLGRNGSGKTTIARMLLGMLEPTRGSATILGDDCRSIRPATRGRIGYVAEGHPLFNEMRIGELERFQRSFYPDWDADLFRRILEQFDLSDRQRCGKLSRGQRAGVSLGLALATRPELLVMDDPAMGLDPVARRTLLEVMILMTRRSGNTIFFSSHQLEDVERVADHIAILDRSILRVCAPIDILHERVKRWSLDFPAPPPVNPPQIRGLLDFTRESSTLRLTVANPDERTDRAIADLDPSDMHEVPLTLEDIVVAYLSGGGEKASLLAESAGGVA